MSVVEQKVNEKPVDLDALGASLEARAAQLEQERQRLSLDALTDETAAVKLASVERDLAGVRAEQERLSLAGEEKARRDKDAAASALAEKRKQALAAAARLQADRTRAAKALDEAADKLFAAISEYGDVCVSQQQKLREAGERGWAETARLPDLDIEATLSRAFGEVRARVGRYSHSLPITGSTWDALLGVEIGRRRPLGEVEEGRGKSKLTPEQETAKAEARERHEQRRRREVARVKWLSHAAFGRPQQKAYDEALARHGKDSPQATAAKAAVDRAIDSVVEELFGTEAVA